MRNSEYWFAAIGLVLFGVLAGRALLRDREAPEPAPDSDVQTATQLTLPPDFDALAKLVDSAAPDVNVISGQVITEDASPVNRAQIRARLLNSDEFSTNKYERSGVNGEFTLRQVRNAARIYFRVSAPGFARVPGEPAGGMIDLESHDLQGVQLVLDPESTASGIVVDLSGVPVAGVALGAQSVEWPYDEPSSAEAGGDGTFTLGQLSPGEYDIGFYDSGMFRGGVSGWQRIRVGRAEALTGLRLVAPTNLRRLHYVSGAVVDEVGNPIENAIILAEDVRIASTGSDGRFGARLENVPVLVVATHPDYSDAGQRIEASGQFLRFELPANARVSGRVVYANTGKPVTNFRVRAGSANHPNLYGYRFQRVEHPQGHYENVPAKSGLADVEVYVNGYPLATTAIAPLQPGESRQGVEVRVNPGTYVQGRVLDAAGQPVRLARVSVEGGWRELSGHVDTTNDDGTFLLGPFADGPLEISVNPFGMEEEVFPTIVSPTLADELVLNLKQQPRQRRLRAPEHVP